ncbi:MAG: Holliday junction resolvase RuvX [Oscillospiraceae bacterium]|nr:Holliday junction resolvase RuvX [Oscillospiraceae bacterium]
MKVIGVDLGEKRTGIAVSDNLEMMAHPLKTIRHDKVSTLIEEILQIIKEHNIERIIIGKPINMDGTEGARVSKTIDFAGKLAEETDIEIELVDERLTTVTAHNILNESGVRGSKNRKNIIDTLSAVIILQQYLDKKI